MDPMQLFAMQQYMRQRQGGMMGQPSGFAPLPGQQQMQPMGAPQGQQQTQPMGGQQQMQPMGGQLPTYGQPTDPTQQGGQHHGFMRGMLPYLGMGLLGGSLLGGGGMGALGGLGLGGGLYDLLHKRH